MKNELENKCIGLNSKQSLDLITNQVSKSYKKIDVDEKKARDILSEIKEKLT